MSTPSPDARPGGPLPEAVLRTLRQRLLQREDELRGALGAIVEANQDDSGREVADFKDIAEESAQAALEDIQAGHAAHELEQLGSALRRMDDGSYGSCLDCGEPIDQRRLETLPATPLCTACQALTERAARG